MCVYVRDGEYVCDVCVCVCVCVFVGEVCVIVSSFRVSCMRDRE